MQDLNVLYQACVFRADRKNKMAAPASDWLRHFRLLLWNQWTEFNEIWQEARSQRPLPSLCFSDRSEKSWPPWPLIGWYIFDFFSKIAERNSTKLDRKQDRNILYQVCVFRADRKNKMAALASDGWDNFDFFSETAERNSRKLYRKQDLNVFYQVCVIGTHRKNKMAALASDWLRHFWFLLWNHWTEFNETWQESKLLTSSTKFVFFGPIWKTRWPPWPLIGWEIFDFSDETAERNSKKLDLKVIYQVCVFRADRKNRKQDLNVFYQICVFCADRKNKMAAQPLIGWYIFDFFSVTAERNLTKLDRKEDLNILYQVCVFRADRKNKMAALASDWQRHFRLLLLNRWTEFNAIWQEARSQRLLPNLCFLCWSEKQDGRPSLWLADTFSTSSLKPPNGIQQNFTGSKI